jgi:Zn-dependent protease
MPFINLLKDPASFIIFLLAIALAIGVHEAAHAWAADKLGDDTARSMGRTSINPLVHLDPMGSLLFLLVGFGWGKPVPVNENRLRKQNNVILVALAGPASNLLTALILSLVYRFASLPTIAPVLELFILVNLSLMVFNLIPIPPLDGSKILRLFLPSDAFAMLEQYGFVLIIVLFFLLRVGNSSLGTGLMHAVDSLFVLFTQTPLFS